MLTRVNTNKNQMPSKDDEGSESTECSLYDRYCSNHLLFF